MAHGKKKLPKKAPAIPKDIPKELFLSLENYQETTPDFRRVYTQTDLYPSVTELMEDIGGDSSEAIVYVPSHKIRITNKPVIECI